MRNALLLLLCSILSACASVPSQDPKDVRAIIDRHNSDAARWYASGDVDSVASLFAEDAWQMPPNNPPLVGREAIRQFWRQAVTWGKWEFALQAQDVSVSGPIAVERGKYQLKFAAGASAPPGMASFQDRGNYLVHWRRDASGEWRALGDAPVSELPSVLPFNAVAEGEKLLRRDVEWASAASAGKDLEKILSYMSDDAIMIPPGQPAVQGKAAIRAFVTASLQIPGFKIQWVSERVTFSPDGKLAYMHGTNATTVPGPKGAMMTIAGRGITIWRHEPDGQWRCVIDIWNDQPQAGAAHRHGI